MSHEPTPDTDGMKGYTHNLGSYSRAPKYPYSGWLRDPRFDPPGTPKREAEFSVPDSVNLIAAECDRIKAMLIEKNLSYGNSALAPIRVVSKADAAEQLRVRIDDKLNRLKNSGDDLGEDTIQDLIGYLVLLRIAMRPKQ